MRAGGVGGRQALPQDGLDLQAADPLDAGLPQQPEREHQVGVGVGVDPVAGQRGRQRQAGRGAAPGSARSASTAVTNSTRSSAIRPTPSAP